MWFEVSRGGLRQLLEGKDKSYILRELVQNAFDEPGVTCCKIMLTPVSGRSLVQVEVEDDAPEGFYDMAHAWTLFAHTRKRKDASKRGRFNLGEKEVLAICEEAKIVTTKGTVRFKKNDERTYCTEDRREHGSVFSGLIPMTRREMQDALDAVTTFIPPPGIEVWINGEALPVRRPLSVMEVTLPTEYEDSTGRYRRTQRKTEIHVYEPLPGEKAMIFEMGLPIIETGDKWHYDIQQRVPMSPDRDNVSPSYLSKVRAEVLNKLAEELTEEDASSTWVAEATENDRIEQPAFEAVLHRQYGDDLASVSVGDTEANHRAAAHGYNVLSGGALTGKQWEKAKEFGSIEPAGKVFPTPHPEFSAGGKDCRVLEEEWTEGMHRVVEFGEAFARELIGGCTFHIVRDKWNRFGAWYSRAMKECTLNLAVLGHSFFDNWPEDKNRVIRTLLHEIAHEQEGDHLSEKYHKALCMLGAAAVELALEKPDLFR